MNRKQVDLLIESRWIIPVIPQDRILENCALAVTDGRITGIYPQSEAQSHIEAKNRVQLGDHVLLPGLINTHTHAAMSLLRGYADDLPLEPWLRDKIWPAENRLVSEAFVRDGVRLAMAEMIRSGTTCFADMYFFPEIAADEIHEAGMRAQVAIPVFDFPCAWGKGPDEYIHKGLLLQRDYRHLNLLRIAFGPHAPYSCSDEVLSRIATYADEIDMPIQIHLHETAQEVADSLKLHQQRPIERIHELGLLKPQTQCVHMTQLNTADIALLQSCNSHVVHCPHSNLKLASGFCPVDELHKAGVNTALGTDGAASNNGLDMFAEMRTAAMLAKAVAGDAATLDAHAALRMATINGAKALGWDSDIGSLEAGKSADMIAVKLDSLEQQPLYNPASQLVYSQCGNLVTHSWVAGKALLQDRQLTTLSQSQLIKSAQQWRDRIG